jgi:hypothetical protein
MKYRSLPFAVLALAACSSGPPYPAWAIEGDSEAIAQVVVTDVTLQDIVRAGRPLVERVQPDDYLRVVVPLRNIDDEEIQVLAQMAFLDQQRQPLGDETNRQVVVLPPGGTSNFQATSRGRRAADFVLRLSWNK